MANRYAVDDANDTNGARTNPNPNLMNIVQPAAFAEVEDAPPDQRELDLRQLEHQVPDTTRGRIEWAYAYSNEDVVRALSLVRMSCILTDRDAMIGFIMAQHVDAQRIEAEASYDLYYADVTEAVIEMVRVINVRGNKVQLGARGVQALRLRTVCRLGTLYRARYDIAPGQSVLIIDTMARDAVSSLQPVEDALGRRMGLSDRSFAHIISNGETVESRSEADAQSEEDEEYEEPEEAEEAEEEGDDEEALGSTMWPFTSTDGAHWRHTRAGGWVSDRHGAVLSGVTPTRPPPPMSVADRLRRRFALAADDAPASADADDAANYEFQWARLPRFMPRLALNDVHAAQPRLWADRNVAQPAPRLLVVPSASLVEEEHAAEMESWAVNQRARDSELNQQRIRFAHNWRDGPVVVRNHIRTLLTQTLQAHTDRERLLGYRFELDRTWSEVLRTVRSWDTPQDFQETIGEEEANGGRQFYADDPIESVSEWSSGSESDTDLMPVRLTSASSSDNESVASEDAGSHVTRRVTRLGHGEGTTGQPSGRSRAATFHREQIKNHLRSVQERVDAEVGRATEGDTFSEGGYLGIMNSIKRIWEAVDHAFIE